MKKLLDFFLFSSLFISSCSVIATFFTAHAFSLVLPLTAYIFIFTGTLSSYSFHWFFTKTTPKESSDGTRWSHKHKHIHFLFLVLAGTASVFLLFLLSKHWQWLVITALITFLYSAPKLPVALFQYLKKFALAKTAFLALVWTHVTCILPFILAEANIDTTAIVYVICRFFFIYAICILFDERDAEKDKIEGIKSMVTHFNDKGIKILFSASLLFSFIALIILMMIGFGNIYLILLFIPLPLLILYYKNWFKRDSDYHYYLVLDGFIMIPGILLLMLRF
ncbi:MAG: UbiA family prenyltransferase [Bacteroidota bacterium]|nr:UbiA family prenyltransferase [Bacteroidota bacterium]